jgi:hypothetical protein
MISLAFSSSAFLFGDRFFPALLMKNCTMRMAEPMPFGLTSLLAMTRAMVSASFVKMPSGGYVEMVVTL